MASPPRTGLWPTCASSPLANDLKAFAGTKYRPGRVGKSDFQKVKTEHFRAFVAEDLQSIERQRVLPTASVSNWLITNALY